MVNTEYKVVLGVVAIIVGLTGYIFYIRDIIRGKTKPHAFSWFVWGILEAIVFFAQISKGAGAGAWVTGTGAVITLLIAAAGLMLKDKDIRPVDWVALAGGIFGIILWQLSHDPLLAVILVAVSDTIGFIPTFRKGYHKPQEETLIEYGLSSVKWLIGVFALQSLSLTTAFYPIVLIITNGSFVVMAMIRRNQLKVK